MAQELVTITREEKEANDLDIECPDCQSLLTIRYDEQDRPRYLCENCEEELSAREIATKDNENIYIVTLDKSNRRFF